MKGRLVPARGVPAKPLSVQEVVKVAQAQAHLDASEIIIRQTFSDFAKHAEGEIANSLRSTIADRVGPVVAIQEALESKDTSVSPGTQPSATTEADPASTSRLPTSMPVAADVASLGLHEDLNKQSAVRISGLAQGLSEREKRAFVFRAARGIASRMAGKGGTVGRVGKFLQKDLPIKGVLKRRAKPAPVTAGPDPRSSRIVEVRSRNMPTPSKPPPGSVKPIRSLLKPLVPGALMLGAGYGLYKGVPAATRWASRAASTPMAYGMGHQQYRYGYTPEGQAQF